MVDNTHWFVGLNAFLIVSMLVMALILSHLLKSCNFHLLDSSGASMILGLVVGGIVLLSDQQNSDYVVFQKEVFFYVILPPIIFEAGYSLKKKHFFTNMGTILLYAVLGTLVSTFVIGFGLYGLALGGAISLETKNPWECLLFGALISCVDPVATLSILGSKKVNADPLIHSLVFGESVLNDAVSIVLFNTFSEFRETDFTNATIMVACGQFFGVSLGAICIGIAVALLLSFIFKRSKFRESPPYEFLLTFFFAYAAYCIAEILHLSGIMSLFFCGICLSHYNWYNISPVSRTTTKHAFKAIAIMAETFLFIYLGVTGGISFRSNQSSTSDVRLEWSASLIFISLFLCLVARAAHIFPFSFLANLVRKRKIPMNMQILLWFAGLRGAIAFALALNLNTPNRPLLVSTTIVIVISTTLICGSLTAPLIRKLRLAGAVTVPDHIQPLVEKERIDLLHHDDEDEEGEGVDDEDKRGRVSLVGSNGVLSMASPNSLVNRWKKFDQNYMKKWFGGRGADHEKKQDEIALEDATRIAVLSDDENKTQYTLVSSSVPGRTTTVKKIRKITRTKKKATNKPSVNGIPPASSSSSSSSSSSAAAIPPPSNSSSSSSSSASAASSSIPIAPAPPSIPSPPIVSSAPSPIVSSAPPTVSILSPPSRHPSSSNVLSPPNRRVTNFQN